MAAHCNTCCEFKSSITLHRLNYRESDSQVICVRVHDTYVHNNHIDKH